MKLFIYLFQVEDPFDIEFITLINVILLVSFDLFYICSCGENMTLEVNFTKKYSFNIARKKYIKRAI